MKAAAKRMNAAQRAWHWLYMALWFNARRRFVRWLLRVGLLPASTKADTDTMGEYKRLMAEKDDPKPGLVLPDPNAPHAALIRRVRLYAQNGAKALAPLLDRGLPLVDADIDWDTASLGEMEAYKHRPVDADALRATLRECRVLAEGDGEALALVLALGSDPGFENPYKKTISAIHAAYNAPWTVIDGEVYEFESEKRKRVVQ